jgi:hypothetical protein
MLKLYKMSDNEKQYWEAWENDDGSQTVHWGVLGTMGDTKVVRSSLLKSVENKVKEESEKVISRGFHEIDIEDHYPLLIEYEVDGMGSPEDLAKRHRLEDRMNETLGWTGLGACDGGSIGSGTMEVCNFVVDFDLARRVVETDLVGTEFANYTRIYENE